MRRLRVLAGLSGRELGRRIGISQSKISRIESGSALPSLPETSAWTAAVGAVAETVRELAALTSAAYLEAPTWRDALAATGHLQDGIRDREAAVTRVFTYQPSVVPGLLQTAEYARRVFSQAPAHYDDETLASVVAARMERQLALYEGGKRFDFLITEAALRWRPGPLPVLAAQWSQLFSVSTLDNVSLGLVLLDREATTPNSHAFVVYGDDDNAFVTLEMIHGPLVLRSPEEVQAYRERWELLSREALFGQRARDYLLELSTQARTLAEEGRGVG